MEKRMIRADALVEVTNRIAGDLTVFAPVREGGAVLFAPLAGREPELDYGNTRNAPKNALFPHTETLVRFTRTPKGMEWTSDGDEPRRAVIFVRPCDARSFLILDRVFVEGGWRDPYYAGRREATTVVALACARPPYAACFCTSVGGGPVPMEADGADLLLTPLGEETLAEAFTPKGEELLSYFQGARPADQQDLARKAEAGAAARAAIRTRVPAGDVKPVLERTFEHPFWATFHQKCLACGTCSYLCPTCHCFDISDEVRGDDGVRIRSWDSCMYPLFTVEASGHNPRPSQRERWRQRMMHKFRYIPENFDLIGCVGCGRCVMNCPVNLDIRKIVQDVAELQTG